MEYIGRRLSISFEGSTVRGLDLFLAHAAAPPTLFSEEQACLAPSSLFHSHLFASSSDRSHLYPVAPTWVLPRWAAVAVSLVALSACFLFSCFTSAQLPLCDIFTFEQANTGVAFIEATRTQRKVEKWLSSKTSLIFVA